MKHDYEKIHLAMMESVVARDLRGKVANKILFRWTRLALGYQESDLILGRAATSLTLKRWRIGEVRGRWITGEHVEAFAGALEYLFLKESARQGKRVNKVSQCFRNSC